MEQRVFREKYTKAAHGGMHMQQPELKGCPFCGEVPTVTEVTGTFVRVHCIGDSDMCPMSPETGWMGSRELAIAAWNKRVPDPLVQQMQQDLQDVLSRFPPDDVILAIMPDAGLGFRPCPPDKNPKDADVIRWRAALKAWQESQQ